MFKKKPYEELLHIINKTTYSNLESFPLGEFRKRPLETKYQYKSNTFAVVDDKGYDFIIGTILQSCIRKDSIMLIDTEDVLHQGVSKFLKRINYDYGVFTFDRDNEQSSSLSLWEQMGDKDNILNVARQLINAVYQYLWIGFTDERDYETNVYGLSAFFAYAAATAMLKHNKFAYLSEFIDNNSIEAIDLILRDTCDTTEFLWTELKPSKSECERIVSISRSIIELLKQPEVNEIISLDGYDALNLSLQKSAITIEYGTKSGQNAVMNIITNIVLSENLVHHEKMKGRAQGINVIINKVEKLDDIEFLEEIINLSRKYKVNFFVTCENVDLFLERFPDEGNNSFLQLFPFVLVQKSLDNAHLKSRLSSLLASYKWSDTMENELLLADNRLIELNPFNVRKHILYNDFIT